MSQPSLFPSPRQSGLALNYRFSRSTTNIHFAEQESLIQTLSEQNANTNQQYQTLLLALPILASIPYVLALFRASTLLTAVLGLTSLSATALLLLRLPPTETGFAPLDAWARSSTTSHDDRNDNPDSRYDGDAAAGPSGMGALDQMRRERRQRRRDSLHVAGPGHAPPKSPLERFLPFLNAGLCAILVATGLLAGAADGAGEQFGLLGLGNLPAIVYGVVVVAKVVMASVDPERELAALRYGYKGA